MPSQLETAALEVAANLPVARGRQGAEYGFDPSLLITTILVPLLTGLLKDCLRPPEEVVRLAQSESPAVRDLVLYHARSVVGTRYSFLGRLWYAGRIERTAQDVANALLLAASGPDFTPDRAIQLMSEAKRR